MGEFQFREPRSPELSPRLPSLLPPTMVMPCLLVLTALVSTPSLTLLTLLMHNSLPSPSNLLHLPSHNLPNLLSDNLLLLLFLNNNHSNLNKLSSPSNPSSPSKLSSLNNPSNPSNPSNHNSNSQFNLPSFSNLPSNLPSDSQGSSRLLPNPRASSTSTDLKAGSTSISPLRLYL